MGLDMYLTAKKFMLGKQNESTLKTIAEAVGGIFGDKINMIEAEAMYWRKANQIHQWFVDNVQSGIDECKQHWVSPEVLKALLNVVTEVLDDKSKAHELLPYAKGFFFGSDEYDEYYFNQLEYTKEELTKILQSEEFDQWIFYYQSSW